DGRAPLVQFHWGKMRDGEKFDPVPLFFDRVAYRLFPLHPYLHLLAQRPWLGTSLISEAGSRYGWKERRARDDLESLAKLEDDNGNSCVSETMMGHSKLFKLTAAPSCIRPPLVSPGDLVQGCNNTGGPGRGASLLECANTRGG